MVGRAVTARPTIALAVVLAAAAAGPIKTADKVEIAAPPVHARFTVPAIWQRRDVTGLPADLAFLFDPAPPSKTKRPTMQQFVEVRFAPAADDETTPAVVADHDRATLLKSNPALKFTKDGAATFAGRPVWTLQWTDRVPLYGPPGKDGKPQVMGHLDVDRVNYVWPDHGATVHIGMHADTRFMPSLVRKAEPVAKSIVWDDRRPRPGTGLPRIRSHVLTQPVPQQAAVLGRVVRLDQRDQAAGLGRRLADQHRIGLTCRAQHEPIPGRHQAQRKQNHA